MASNNPSTPNVNVPIRIEPTDEYQIAEISFDGQEKYIQPLSMSENLARLIQKIDFNQPLDELRDELEKKPDDSGDLDVDKPQAAQSTGSSWPFDSVRAKLRLALTEICVLVDVLSITKEKKYMVFDAVNAKGSDQRQIVGLLAKKSALQNAWQNLQNGGQYLKSLSAPKPMIGLMNEFMNEGLASTSTSSTSDPNFYDELKEMRRNWRLRRIGSNIIGELSFYRPSNYRFASSSRFEVIKTGPGTRGSSNQALAVKIPSELEGRAHIQVSIIKSDDISLVDLCTTTNGRCHEPLKEVAWQEKLEAAQNVLYCKELFCHLANQAVQYQFVIPTVVTGNQIILALFPDIKLYITLVHRTPNTKCSSEMSGGMKKLQKEHKSVFEHSLHQMLKEFYANAFRRMQGRDIPRESGPFAMDKQTSYELRRDESSLDKIVSQAQHLIMRQQTMEVIDTFATKIKDPLIISHWFCLNSPTTSIVRVDIVSHNNEILGRSHMLIYIGTRQLRVITRDCKNLLLGYEPDELYHLLIWQSCLHQFIASDKLSKLLGWYTLILNYSVNVTRQDQSSTAFSLVICSSNCTHMISMKSGPQFGLTLEVAPFKDSDDISNTFSSLTGGDRRNSSDSADTSIEYILSSSFHKTSNEVQLCKLQQLVANFREIDWNCMEGKDFLTRLELLMASLTDLK